MKEAKIMEIEDSEVWYKVITRRFKDVEGQAWIESKWKLADRPIELGSIARPNPNIIGIKIRVPSEKRSPIFSFFDN